MKKQKRSDFPKGEIVIYKTKDGKAKLEVNLREETVWLNLNQIANLFGRDKSVVSRHLKNIFKDNELDKDSVVAFFATTAADGKIYNVEYYNLDVIISVGYRISSQRATQFRIWATRVLRDHLLKGFTINEQRIKGRHQAKLGELEKAVRLLKSAMNSKKLLKSEAEGLLQVITDYTNSWLLLQKYDEGKLAIQKKTTKYKWEIDHGWAKKAIIGLKSNLIKKKQATEIFGQERGHGLEAIVGNLNQSFGGKKLYPTLEEKAAHLLYFVIKDHPLIDGNKRSASLLFIQFLAKNNFLFRKDGERKINDNTLVALALLVAESNPKEKDVMIALITNLLYS